MSLSKSIIDFILQQLSGKFTASLSSPELRPVGGGSINGTYQLIVNKHEKFFLKCNDAGRYPGLFEKEKTGLQFLANQHCLRIPSVIFCGTHHNEQLLVLEWITAGERNGTLWKKSGEQLARLHQCSTDRFGFAEDNYMGALPQTNTFHDSWMDFFIRQRLVPQVKLATGKKLLPAVDAGRFDRLYKKMDSVFNREPPSLLHGDLWSGNFMCDERSEPVLIDPAVYYGHRSMDLAMTTLFGGFDSAFYDAYHYHFPLPPNYREQWDICNLYPLLIHLNLFGQSYLQDIVTTLKKFE
jgi:protein-ribulosamine 3-kinase